MAKYKQEISWFITIHIFLQLPLLSISAAVDAGLIGVNGEPI